MDEHRYIMECHLGRKLSSNEVIHHKDNNRQNNCLDNLELMTRSEHAKLHSKDRILSDETKKKLSEIFTGHRNSPCHNFSDDEITTIKDLFDNKHYSLRKIGRLYNVDKNVISRLLKRIS